MLNNRKADKDSIKSYKPVLQVAVFTSVLLLIARIVYTGRMTYLFLLWNLFLAYLPYLISKVLTKTETWKNNIVINVMLLSLWIIFLPNAPYIVTDLFHLADHIKVPLWYDLIMFLFFAMAGLVFWLLSVFYIYRTFFQRSCRKIRAVYFSLVTILSSLGVYIGRYLRWNSWDLVINGPALLHDVMTRLIHPTENLGIYGMTIIYSLFLGFICYGFQGFYLPKKE